MSKDGRPNEIFDERFGIGDLFAETILRELEDLSVIEAMDAKFVSVRGNLSDQAWISGGHLAEHEKGPADAMLGHLGQEARRVMDDRMGRGAVAIQPVSGQEIVIILNIYGERVYHEFIKALIFLLIELSIERR